MRVQIRARTPSSVKLKFQLGLRGLQGIPGDTTPEFIALAAQVNDDAAAVTAAMATLGTIETNVDADRIAAQSAKTDAETAATNAEGFADSAHNDSLTIQGLLNTPLDMGDQTEALGQSYDLGEQGT